MTKPVAYFALSHGMRGCYLPDTEPSAFMVTKRRDLASIIRSELEMYGAPKSAINTVALISLWKHIKSHGASSLHFTIDTTEGYCLNFSGLTEEEYNNSNDCE